METITPKTLCGRRAWFVVRHSDGSDIDDPFGARGQMTHTRQEAELLASEHRAAGSDVTIEEID